jgi:hypothetical protein
MAAAVVAACRRPAIGLREDQHLYHVLKTCELVRDHDMLAVR